MGENDKWKGYKEASFIKLLELFGGDTVNYTASAYRFSNPERNHLNTDNTVDPSHPILSALEKQAQFYELSGEAQKRASLPSMNLLGGYAYRGTGINPMGPNREHGKTVLIITPIIFSWVSVSLGILPAFAPTISKEKSSLKKLKVKNCCTHNTSRLCEPT
ncbi:hypothetical protein [Algoriphagus boritolerans]|uniref:hypothetical protein n=1 Tax=Algoriphagus boritolerans TaxID=308111 RepID=UPI000A996A57